MSLPIRSTRIAGNYDLLIVRRRTRQIAAALGFDYHDQTRLATAVSEIARNAFQHTGGGRVDFSVEGSTAPQVLLITIADAGSGMPALPARPTGPGSHRMSGIEVARRLVDQFQVDTAPHGTTVSLRKLLQGKEPLTVVEVTSIAHTITSMPFKTAFEEIQEQNLELLSTLDELRRCEQQLEDMNRELEETNQGVMALYAELEEKAVRLRNADRMKTRFLSNMSHEFRTPLNSVLGLSGILLAGDSATLTDDQKIQIGFIRKAAGDLMELVNDLLDIAKVEAGKIEVRAAEFEVPNLFAALRGLMRPLLVNPDVSLIIEDPIDIPPIHNDEAKVSQVLRNLISNALKFTTRGEVRVSVHLSPERDSVIFTVADTGPGIDPADQETIFEEFTQIDGPHQNGVKGTGLGLPLCRKLAELIHGRVLLKSFPGVGSVFSLVVPLVFRKITSAADLLPVGWGTDPRQVPVLVIEDRDDVMLARRKALRSAGFSAIPARTANEARQLLGYVHPKAIVLRSGMPDESSWPFLTEIKSNDLTRLIPIVVIASTPEQAKAVSLGADVCLTEPVEVSILTHELSRVIASQKSNVILIIDDEPAARYILKHHLAEVPCTILESDNGNDGVRLARTRRPQAIFLDLMMPEISGFDTLERLKSDPSTRDIPVIVTTAKVLDVRERRLLTQHADTILPKEATTTEMAVSQIKRVLVNAGLEFQTT
jgi:signal transduction histidine kinase/CheY-like chemotaxis protein